VADIGDDPAWSKWVLPSEFGIGPPGELERSFINELSLAPYAGHWNDDTLAGWVKRFCLGSLAFVEMDVRRKPVFHETSARWIFEHQAYQQWINQNHGILWIKVGPGSGKSIMMRAILQRFQSSAPSDDLVLLFLFRRTSTALSTSLGMYQSMLYQLFDQSSSTLTPFQAPFEEMQGSLEDQENVEWDFHQLHDMFSKAVLEAARAQNVKIILDAIDEADGDEARMLLIQDLSRLQKQVSKQHGAVSVCFSCRPYPTFDTSSLLQISIGKSYKIDLMIGKC
jgi:hypothetical protein